MSNETPCRLFEIKVNTSLSKYEFEIAHNLTSSNKICMSESDTWVDAWVDDLILIFNPTT